MKIAVIGTGIAGNVAAWSLSKKHDVTVFEADDRIGGHTNTVDVELGGQSYAVDTGFIVFNDWTYPKFIGLLDELGVDWQDSEMGFSVQHHESGLEYSGSSLNTLFAQRRNLLRPAFHRMIRDILRFNRQAPALLEDSEHNPSLAEYLQSNGYSREFRDHYIIPMGAAIWSANCASMQDMPARFFVRFFQNHGLLSVKDRPVWKVIRGGSRQYLDKLVAGHRSSIFTNARVEAVWRFDDRVRIKVSGRESEDFDQVFVACHSDQALKLLADASPQEREVLGSIEYQSNEAVLHTDASLMPSRKRAWSAWNYHILGGSERPVAVTYNMNILQQLNAPEQFCVTLNNSQAIAPEKIIRRFNYSHPVFTLDALKAQSRHQAINGVKRTYYCGAYWRNGFHEDGVVSALNALEHFKQRQIDAQRYLQRTG